MIPYPLNFLHIGRFLITCDDHIGQSQKGPSHNCDQKDISLVEKGVKLEIVHLQPQNHIDLSIGSVGGEGADAQLRDAY